MFDLKRDSLRQHPWLALPGDFLAVTHGQTRRARRARTQPEEHRCGNPPRQAGGHHRAVRLRQIQPGVRHHLRRRPAALCRIALGLRPPVPGADGKTGRGPDRGPEPRDLDRSARGEPESALDGRHHHRDLRLPAPALCPHRRAPLPQLRPRDQRADGRADRGQHPGVSRGQPAAAPGAAGDGPQGRAQRRLRGCAQGRLRARARGWAGVRAGDAARA